MSLSSTGSPAAGRKASNHVSISYDSSVEAQPVSVGREASVSRRLLLRPQTIRSYSPAYLNGLWSDTRGT